MVRSLIVRRLWLRGCWLSREGGCRIRAPLRIPQFDTHLAQWRLASARSGSLGPTGNMSVGVAKWLVSMALDFLRLVYSLELRVTTSYVIDIVSFINRGISNILMCSVVYTTP